MADGGPSTARELADCLANMPTDLFEVVRQLPVLHELPGLELIGRASEQGWAWRSAAGLGLGLPGWLEVKGMAAAVEAEAAVMSSSDDDFFNGTISDDDIFFNGTSSDDDFFNGTDY